MKNPLAREDFSMGACPHTYLLDIDYNAPLARQASRCWGLHFLAGYAILPL